MSIAPSADSAKFAHICEVRNSKWNVKVVSNIKKVSIKYTLEFCNRMILRRSHLNSTYTESITKILEICNNFFWKQSHRAHLILIWGVMKRAKQGKNVFLTGFRCNEMIIMFSDFKRIPIKSHKSGRPVTIL